MAADDGDVLSRPALRLGQNPNRPVFLLALTGEELLAIADVNRIARDESGDLLGYQRPEVRRHVRDIVRYLNRDDAILPNSIVVALSSRAHFRRGQGARGRFGPVTQGRLEIPLTSGSQPKPGWIVDGQQRALALAESRRRAKFPVPVSAFITDDVAVQRDQFLRVNNVKPLPRGLITELLPGVPTPLPGRFALRRVPSALCDQLNRRESSPFRGLIRRASTPPEARRAAVVADTSIVRMIQGSLFSPAGCLFPYHNLATGESDTEGMWAVLMTYWTGVREVFPFAWGLPPTESRLMHGAGIVAMGRLMDRIMASVRVDGPRAARHAERALRVVAPACRWTGGRWEGLDLDWDEVQNFSGHVRMLSDYLVHLYVQGWSAAT